MVKVCSGKGMLSVGYCRKMVYSFAALVFAAGRGVTTAPGVELTEEKTTVVVCCNLARCSGKMRIPVEVC